MHTSPVRAPGNWPPPTFACPPRCPLSPGAVPRDPDTAFSAFGVEPFPVIEPGDDLATALTTALHAASIALHNGDVLIIASKVVSISENRHVELAGITPGPEALELSARTGKPAALVQLILDESVAHFLATEHGPIIATHKPGYRLTSAGIDTAGTAAAR